MKINLIIQKGVILFKNINDPDILLELMEELFKLKQNYYKVKKTKYTDLFEILMDESYPVWKPEEYEHDEQEDYRTVKIEDVSYTFIRTSESSTIEYIDLVSYSIIKKVD